VGEVPICIKEQRTKGWDGGRKGQMCKRGNRNFSWQARSSLWRLKDNPARGSHQAEAEEP